MIDTQIENSIDGAVIRYRIMDSNDDKRKISFVVQDVQSFTELNIVEIISLKSTIKGQGRKLLQQVCDRYCKNPIVLKCEPLYNTLEQYEEACKSGKHAESLEKLSLYYSSCGFININEYVDYSNGIAFLYDNEPGNIIYKQIQEFIHKEK